MARSIGRSAVDRLVVEHLPAALRFALRLTGDADVAEDVVQEALCLVLRRWRSYRGEASFGTWLLKIVVNVDRDRRRRQRDELPMPAAEVASHAAPPAEQAAADELHARVRAAIARLPQRQREVALLSLGEGLPARDVARVLDITEANVHTCLHLARKRIAQSIGVEYARPDPT
jgi:RNA polymerase sigma-70 factor (ECF subfamily)